MKKSRTVKFFAGLAIGIAMMTPVQSATYNSPLYTFSIDDVQGGFDGSTFGTDGAVQDDSILCDAPGSSASCQAAGISPITSPKMPPGSGTSPALYPVDSEFGFYVVDFLGGAQKIRDGDYLEGFIGNITASFPTGADVGGMMFNYTTVYDDPALANIYDAQITGGVAVSNASTDTYKAKTPLGSWCRGLGGNSVKCETEHYSVLEHVLSCHEVIPYFFADEVSGVQAVLPTDPLPVNFGTTDCALKGLDDVMMILENDAQTIRLTDATVGVQMEANDKTVLTDDIAVSSDYAVRLKADGKANYTWGGMVKLPNDIRIYKRLALPAPWKQAGANFPVTAAKLVIRHTITNNPNDQLRPEDIENEAATGRKPSYTVTPNNEWISTIDCFEGDGDFIDTDEGASDPHAIAAGTVLKNTPFAFTGYNALFDLYAFSGDLVNGFTNAYYTTINRDPFEWSYDADADPLHQDFVGSQLQNDALGTLVTGPRWRLRPNKFGQDLPGLEIPLIECSEPPFEKDNIKYNVGVQTITEINLLDWDTVNNGPSPLATTRGWVDYNLNGAIDVAQTVNGPVSDNGLPMTDDFDLAIYIKGDKKPVAIYDAQLMITWDDQTTVLVDVPDVVGFTEAAAVAAIQAAALVDNVVYESSDTVMAGIVTRTLPAACTACVAIDSTVDIYVSTGPAAGTLDVANVVGLTEAAALAALDPQLVTVVNYVNDPAPAGEVIAQVPTACVACADPGDTVTLTVSNGPVVIMSDVTVSSVSVPSAVFQGVTRTVSVTIVNAATASGDGTGTVTVTATDGTNQVFTFTNLAPGATRTFSFSWTSPTNPVSGTVIWTFDVTVGGVIVDTATDSTKIRGFSG